MSGLALIATPADYTLTIPQLTLNTRVAKSISAVKTISGGASVTIWASSAAGEQHYFTANLSDADFNKLKNIVDCDVEDWLIRSAGKTYLAVLSMPSARQNISINMWRVELQIVIVSEVSK